MLSDTYAECHIKVSLSVGMLNVVMLNVVILNVVMLSVVTLTFMAPLLTNAARGSTFRPLIS